MADLDTVWIQLNEADACEDPETLARIAWDLYAQLGQAYADDARLRTAIAELAQRAEHGMLQTP